MGTDPKGPAAGDATLSAARLALAVRRAGAEAGASGAMLLSEPIAIVGMGCRFPGGADGPDGYWRLLDEGRSGIRAMPAGRWDAARETLAPHLLLGGYLDGIDGFDAEFFGIAPREAHGIDPQQRLLLEVCWEALADAAIAPSALSGTDAGVFVAVYNSDYARMQLEAGAVADGQMGVGAAHSVASGRLSFLLNLRGPCMTVDTACSSSLVATHLACQSLRRRECGLALVAGASLKLLPDEVRAFAQWGMLASDGQAKTFDARADGFVPGEGCGVVVLKRLSDAVAQGDRIRAVIRGSAMGHDGRSSVLTAPNGPAQEAVIRAALKDGQVKPGDVGFVETHGTGTSLGDPIEVEALDAVYGTASSAGERACVLGAVKTNFGHLEAAAGVAGLIKTVLVLERESIPRNLNFVRLNPQIQLAAGSRIELAAEAREWVRAAGRTRFAGVSSFGLGGTNAHVIVEEAPVLPRMTEAAAGEAAWCLPISAHTAEGLERLARGFVELMRKPDSDLSQIAVTAARGRDHAAFRIAVSGATAAEVAEKLEARLAGMDWAGAERRAEAGGGRGRLAFVFSGQGSVWVGALKALVEGFPEAEKVVAACERVAAEAGGFGLRMGGDDAAALEDTAKGQPLLFALQMALVRVLEGWGVVAEAVAGHSVGEVAAAVTAGVLTLEDGMRLVVKRGRHMGSAGPGRMLAAEMGEDAAAAVLAESSGIELAAVNGPRAVVFAGAAEPTERLAGLLEGRGVSARWLEVGYAFHSAAMDGARRALEADLRAGLEPKPVRSGVTLVSTVTGGVWTNGDGDAAYWGRGIREWVRFREAAERLIELGCETVVEIGPHPVLLRSVAECGAATTVAAMRRGQPARATLMAMVAALYEAGRELRWAKIYPGTPAHAALPTYPWERRRYWLAETPRISARILARDAGGELASSEVSSAFVEGRVWETRLDLAETPWLAEHCWREKAILPFAAWLELARQVASEAEGGPVRLREFAVLRRLELGAAGAGLQTLVSPGRQLKAAARADGEWVEFASGFYEPAEDGKGTGPNGAGLDLDAWRGRATERVEIEALYGGLGRVGLTYGPAFRLLRGVVAGPGFALGEVAGPVRAGVQLHPAMLDACLQTLQAAQAEELRGVHVLPVSLGSYCVYRTRLHGAAGEVFALAERKSVDRDPIDTAFDITLVDRGGGVVAELRGLVVRRVEAAAPAPMWEVVWSGVAEEPPGQVGVELDGAPVLVSGDLGEVTAELLRVVRREADLSGSVSGSVRGVRVVTRGGLAVGAGDEVDPAQAAILGLVRSFRAEYPSIAVQILDLPLGVSNADEAVWLGQVGGLSGEMAWRDGRWLRPRLVRLDTDTDIDRRETALQIGTPGLLESLHEEPFEALEPGAGEVQIAVVAHGLNFRDVLTAMGAYAGVAAPLGAECAGVVVKAGDGAALAVGTAVVAFAPGSLRSVVSVPEAYVAAKPRGMSFAEAATIPVAFLTAHFGFSRLAGLKAGQTVLVHSAAGGLGQAAVQLARRAEARVIATAGTAEKRAWLRAQGVEHVFDSRTDLFAEDVLRVTGGRGVDVVLNALSGDKIAAGFKALAPGGAFLEVGKRDIWSAERVAEVRPDARYWAFDLGEVALREPGLIREMMGEILAGVAAGELAPVRLQMYSMAAAEDAFRTMAGGQHVGKLVLMREAGLLTRAAWEQALRTGTVLITGGTGALGLAAARWLLAQGARRVVLVSRGGELPEELAAEFGERVVVKRADVCDRAQMAAVLERVRAVAPLKVVMHAAGVVEDRLLGDHTEASFAEGLRTKVEGARILAELTGGDGLAVTVYFSSLAALLGSAGQGSYAAANAYLDGLAEERSARGLPTLSVNWGAWGGGGMAGRLSAAAAGRMARQGMRPMAPEGALAALGEAILSGRASGRARVAIADVDWEACLEQVPAGSAGRGFFEGYFPAAGVKVGEPKAASDAKNREVDEILGLARAERLPRMEAYVRAAARKVLGLSAGRPMPGDAPLQEMGLDSLMALEMRNVLVQALGRPLNATLLFDYPTIRGLAQYLLGLIAEPEVVAGEIAGEDAEDRGAAGWETDVELAAMSDAEAEELLLAELDGKGAS